MQTGDPELDRSAAIPLSGAQRWFTASVGRFHWLCFFVVVNGTFGCASPKQTPAPLVPARQRNETDQIIDSVLDDMRNLESARPKASTIAAPPATLPPDADSFDADRERIRSSVGAWAHGAGATLRFLKEATGERLSLIFVDESPPAFDSGSSVWTITTRARVSGGKVVGHFVLLLKTLQPGKYRGDDHTSEVKMGILMGKPTWDAQNPETAWSMNRESWCEVELKSTTQGALEGNFRGRLVDNKGTGFINVESGFLFMKR